MLFSFFPKLFCYMILKWLFMYQVGWGLNLLKLPAFIIGFGEET